MEAGTSSLSKKRLWINPLCLFPELTALMWAGWLSIVKCVSAPPSKNSPAVSTFALSTQTSSVSFSNTTRCCAPAIVTVQVFKIYWRKIINTLWLCSDSMFIQIEIYKTPFYNNTFACCSVKVLYVFPLTSREYWYENPP